MPRLPAVPSIALVLLLPSAALAGAPYDPNLHVDPSVEDCSVHFATNLTQDAFKRFAREFGSVSAFKQASPPTTLGPWGIAVDVEQIFFSVEEKSAAWNDTFVHPNAYHPLGSDKSFPKLRLRVGATDDLEVGAFFTKSQKANYGWFGLEAKYAILHQRDDAPFELAVRGAYTKTLYVSDMDMHAFTADVSIGRTFWRVLTPYLGVGSDVVLARETSDAVNLKSEALFVPHLTAGAEVRYWHVAIGAEVQVGALTSYQAQVSAVF
jgi:hypothetical protein